MEEITITLESLYDMLRQEKQKGELQTLPKTFYVDVASYVQKKRELLKKAMLDDTVFAAGDNRQLSQEVGNIQRILKELYEKREKKIITMALNRSRTGSDIIDTSSLLMQEKTLYQDLVQKFDQYRLGIALKLAAGQNPIIETTEHAPTLTTKDGQGKIAFVLAVPRFVWKEGKVFGPYKEGQQAKLPEEVAELLIRKKRAVPV